MLKLSAQSRYGLPTALPRFQHSASASGSSNLPLLRPCLTSPHLNLVLDLVSASWKLSHPHHWLNDFTPMATCTKCPFSIGHGQFMVSLNWPCPILKGHFVYPCIWFINGPLDASVSFSLPSMNYGAVYKCDIACLLACLIDWLIAWTDKLFALQTPVILQQPFAIATIYPASCVCVCVCMSAY